jgi:spermidine/putrescine transport system permease protein
VDDVLEGDLPLFLPGIAAAACSPSASRSTTSSSPSSPGTVVTFPLWVWASIRNNLPPQVQVIGTMIFVGSVGLVLLSTLWQRRQARRATV